MKWNKHYDFEDLVINKQSNGKYLIYKGMGKYKLYGEIIAYNLNKDLLIRKIAKLIGVSFDVAKLAVEKCYISRCFGSSFLERVKKSKLSPTTKKGIKAILLETGDLKPRIESVCRKYKAVGNGRFSWFSISVSADTKFEIDKKEMKIDEFIESLNENIKRLGINVRIIEDK